MYMYIWCYGVVKQRGPLSLSGAVSYGEVAAAAASGNVIVESTLLNVTAL